MPVVLQYFQEDKVKIFGIPQLKALFSWPFYIHHSFQIVHLHKHSMLSFTEHLLLSLFEAYVPLFDLMKICHQFRFDLSFIPRVLGFEAG